MYIHKCAYECMYICIYIYVYVYMQEVGSASNQTGSASRKVKGEEIVTC